MELVGLWWELVGRVLGGLLEEIWWNIHQVRVVLLDFEIRVHHLPSDSS